MPFDREGTLRKAEKLLRQGKLDLAIAEYRSVIDDQPTDWNTTNTLGDLYFRAGQVDKAVVEYGRFADHLASEGFFPKAVALYRKILKIKPDEERAMWHLGVIAARQGLLVDARANFLTLVERRRARGDRRGEAEARIQLGDLDGADLDTRLAGARARVGLGDLRTAVQKLKQVAYDLQEKGKAADALRLLTEAFTFDPEDTELRRLLIQAHAARGDFDTARQYATTSVELKGVAEELFKRGREDEALTVLAAAAEADPTDTTIRAQLVSKLVARGDTANARRHLTLEVAGDDPELLWTLAEMELRGGRIAEGTAVLRRILAEHPGQRDALVILGCSVAEVNADAGFECIEVAAQAAIAADEWGAAAAALNEFVSRVTSHIPALMRLVEICVDGGLEATMYSAQAQLADAYLEAGAGAEARVIAEDLVAREPWERANIERFRRALSLLGEQNIDATIADRLSGQAPFTSTDALWLGEREAEASSPPPAPEPPTMVAPPSFVEPVRPPEITAKPAPSVSPAPPPPRPSQPAPERNVFSLGPDAIDLSDVLHDLQGEGAASSGAGQPAASIESVLEGMREEATRDSSPETAEQHYKLASTYVQMGLQDDAIKALEVAARSPRHRFRAGAMLAQMYLERGDRGRAIEWYERAAEAPSPDSEAHHALLYDLATALEAQGESARALAVLLELQSDAGDYRDLVTRLEHLTKVQMGS